jgi:hypothetical protein
LLCILVCVLFTERRRCFHTPDDFSARRLMADHRGCAAPLAATAGRAPAAQQAWPAAAAAPHSARAGNGGAAASASVRPHALRWCRARRRSSSDIGWAGGGTGVCVAAPGEIWGVRFPSMLPPLTEVYLRDDPCASARRGRGREKCQRGRGYGRWAIGAGQASRRRFYAAAACSPARRSGPHSRRRWHSRARCGRVCRG